MKCSLPNCYDFEVKWIFLYSERTVDIHTPIAHCTRFIKKSKRLVWTEYFW